MKLVITTAWSEGAGNGTSQSLHYYAGQIDGAPVEFTYLDAGNNAEYDDQVSLEMNRGGIYREALLEHEDRFGLLQEGDVLELNPAAVPTQVTLKVDAVSLREKNFLVSQYHVEGSIEGESVSFLISTYPDNGAGAEYGVFVFRGDEYKDVLQKWADGGQAEKAAQGGLSKGDTVMLETGFQLPAPPVTSEKNSKKRLSPSR